MNAPSVAAPPSGGPVKVRAAGCVVWRHGAEGIEVALIHRPRYDDWSFPKGKLDPGEDYLTAALREVREETGFGVLLGRRLPTQVYDVSFGGPHRMKRVKYWAAQAVGESDFVPNNEVDQLEWLGVEAAHERLTRQTDRDLLGGFAALPVDTVPVVLLRHASATNRKHWSGPEAERPLTRTGRTEAESLAPVLAAYGDLAYFSSPWARCMQTVTPAAELAGKAITAEPLLTEDGSRDAAREWFRHLVKTEQTAVVCSHRPVIPALLAESSLGQVYRASRRALDPAEGWVLHLRDGAPVALDRVRVGRELTGF